MVSYAHLAYARADAINNSRPARSVCIDATTRARRGPLAPLSDALTLSGSMTKTRTGRAFNVFSCDRHGAARGSVRPHRRSHPEVFAEAYPAHTFIVDDLIGSARGQHFALIDDAGAIADTDRLAHVVVGDQHADVALL